MMSELKACPFCAKAMDTDYSLKKDDPTRVICWQCGAEGELSEWNNRPIEDKLAIEKEDFRKGFNEVTQFFHVELVKNKDLICHLREAVEEMKAYPLSDVKMSEVLECIKKHIPELDEVEK